MKHKGDILIVDDEPVGRDVLEALLAPQGYNLAFASNGPETLQKAAELIPDLILLDVMMPDMDGFEVCHHLRADPILVDVPIILVTALDDRDARLRGIEAGADDFITKPFDRIELRARVRAITRLNRFQRLLVERSKFDWVVDQADDGYVVINDKGEISYANQQARLYLNLSTEQNFPTTRTFNELVREQYRLEPQRAWTQEVWLEDFASDRQTPRYLVRPESPTANAFWLQVQILKVYLLERTNSDWIIRLRDVTTQMNMHREMWQFHSMVSHKFRTPLIPVTTSLELLAAHTKDMTEEEIAQYAEMALEGVSRLRDEVNNILRYLEASKLSQMSVEDRFELYYLQLVVTKICTELSIESVTFNGLEELGNDLLKCRLSRQAMELILRELLENAKKFHPKQTPTMIISVSCPNHQDVSIQVADDGLNLSPDQLTRVWIPYYQGEKWFTGEATGMGLGLPMVASMVWGIGGMCRMYNREEGVGVVLELVLPLEMTPGK
jgi:two-component system cell cycle response regulator